MVSKQEAAELASRLRNSIKLQNEIAFSDMNIKTPEIDLYPDERNFYDFSRNEIHLGYYGALSIFAPETEEEFVNALTYLRGHEEEHCRSTAGSVYAWGIQRGCESVVEYISSKVDKTRRKFRSPSDYENYANEILPKQGIYVSWDMVKEMIASVINSIEDGRIERIRSCRNPGFESLRIFFRGRFWNTDTEYEPWEAVKDSPVKRLNLIINQILSLATCQLYCKGFLLHYGDTPLTDEVKALMPHIARGVMAGRTRDMAMEVIELCKKLAPLIYEACKMSAEDAAMRKMLQKMVADIIKACLDEQPENNLSEKDEKTDDGSGTSVFSHSDLVITLDDETYDKLEKKAKENGGSGGLMIRREHPKEEPSESGDGENPAEDGGGRSGKDPDGSSSGADGTDTSGSPSGEEDHGGSGTEKEDAGGKTASSDAKAPDGYDTAGDGSSDRSSESASGGSSSKPGQGIKPSGSEKVNGKDTAVASGADDDAAAAVLKDMAQAAESSREEAKAHIDNINTGVVFDRRSVPQEHINTDKPVSAETVKDICSNFREFTRKYKLTDNLPPVVAARGKSLRRKNERYFRSISTPNISYLDSGLVDPSRLYSLSFGDTEVFRKKGRDRKFDGAVYILLDNSGSMYGNKRTEACKAAAVMEEGFKGLIPIKIVAFDYSGGVIHEVIKGFDESARKNCCWNFCLHGRDGCGNADGYDIKIAARELLARPESKKLLIVLSDGMPAEASPGYTAQAIEEARKAGITLFGIYFEEGRVGGDAEQFRQMYKKDYICCELSDVDEHLSRLLKRFSRS